MREAARLNRKVAVHATGEPGTGMAARAGVASVDHADQLSNDTMKLMRERGIFAVPTFTVIDYFAAHAATPQAAERYRAMQAYHIAQFKLQLAAHVPMAVGSDVGPFPHGTQAKEYALMVANGMSSLAALQAGLINGAKLLGWEKEIGRLSAGYYADVIAVPGNPLDDIGVLQHVEFVMKNGVVITLKDRLEAALLCERQYRSSRNPISAPPRCAKCATPDCRPVTPRKNSMTR